jgi:hypothetical protein
MSSSSWLQEAALANLKQLWSTSLLFRRVSAGSVFVLAALLVYLGSHIPRSVSLPADDLNAKSMARIREEQIVIQKPDIAPGGLALSYVGSKNEVADLWLENATLDDRSQHLLFPQSAVPARGKIGYTTVDAAGVTNSGDTCHTTIEVRLAKDSAPLDALTLYQTDEMAGAQRYRQVIMEAGAATMEIVVHTDSPTETADGMGLLSCHKLLTVADRAAVDLPPIPIRMLVSRGKIDLHFNPANPALSIFTGPKKTFEAVSLGESTLRARGLQVVAAQQSSAPRLDVRSRSAGSITFSRLRIGEDMLKLDIGRDAESAVAYANGSSVYNYDLIDTIQKNPILSFAFATVLVPALWNWIRKNCFPRASGPTAATTEEQPADKVA